MTTRIAHLTIPTPCPQRWQNMTADGTGRFCTSCQKTVVDFTNLTDQQIVRLLARPNGSTCGRFRVSQLNRELSAVTPTAPRLSVRLFGLITVGLLGYQPALAGYLPTPVAPTEHPATKSTATRLVPPIVEEAPPVDSLLLISGRVMERTTNTGIPGVFVIIKGSLRGSSTDAEGKFRVTIPVEQMNEPITLRVGGIGYLTQEVQLGPSQSTPIVISLSIDEVTLGEVIVVGNYKRPTFFQRLRSRLRPNH